MAGIPPSLQAYIHENAGERERNSTLRGWSHPLVFCIGKLLAYLRLHQASPEAAQFAFVESPKIKDRRNISPSHHKMSSFHHIPVTYLFG